MPDGFPGTRLLGGTAVALAALLGVAACSSGEATDSPTAPGAAVQVQNPTGDPAQREPIEAAMRKAIADNDLKALIVRVTRGGQDVYTGAMGESMAGVPATPDMRFRNGALAFTYISETVLKMVDQGMVSLDDPLSTWFPEIKASDKVTVKNLLNMTSGYADYVYQPRLGRQMNRNPFRQWTNDDLLAIAMAAPMDFEPGTNWGYSHTNYVLLGEILQELTGKPLSVVLQEYVLDPMGLTSTTSNNNTPAIPEPVLHAYSSERRTPLGVSPRVPFSEESTFWNPSWTTAEGAVQTTDVVDMTRSMEIVGSGEQLSQESYREQVGPNLLGFGKPDPSGRCSACKQNTESLTYGLGVALMGPWITQTKNFAGSGATTGYLPAEKVAISTVTTYLPSAYGPDGAPKERNPSMTVFNELAAAVTPDHPAPAPAPTPAAK